MELFYQVNNLHENERTLSLHGSGSTLIALPRNPNNIKRISICEDRVLKYYKNGAIAISYKFYKIQAH